MAVGVVTVVILGNMHTRRYTKDQFRVVIIDDARFTRYVWKLNKNPPDE